MRPTAFNSIPWINLYSQYYMFCPDLAWFKTPTALMSSPPRNLSGISHLRNWKLNPWPCFSCQNQICQPRHDVANLCCSACSRCQKQQPPHRAVTMAPVILKWLDQNRNEAPLGMCLEIKVKIWHCKEWHRIGTWNRMYMNQGKLDAVNRREQE